YELGTLFGSPPLNGICYRRGRVRPSFEVVNLRPNSESNHQREFEDSPSITAGSDPAAGFDRIMVKYSHDVAQNLFYTATSLEPEAWTYLQTLGGYAGTIAGNPAQTAYAAIPQDMPIVPVHTLFDVRASVAGEAFGEPIPGSQG